MRLRAALLCLIDAATASSSLEAVSDPPALPLVAAVARSVAANFEFTESARHDAAATSAE